MTERQNIRIKVCNVEQYDGDWPTPGYETSLLNAIRWFTDKMQQIPREYQETATCEIDSASGYEGSHYGHIEISYQRPETDEEQAERLLRQAQSEQLVKAREMATLAALQAKYPKAG